MVGRHRDRRTALRVWAKALSSSKLCRPDCATVPRKGRERVVGKTRPLRPCCALPGRRSPASRISWAPRAPLPSIRINSPGTRSFRWTTSGVSPTEGSGLLLTSIGISSAPINTRPTSPGCQRLYAAFGNGCPGRHAAGAMALRGRGMSSARVRARLLSSERRKESANGQDRKFVLRRHVVACVLHLRCA